MIHFFILPAVALLALACDESFNPKEEFKQQYVLQCFVTTNGPQGSPVSVTAVLARTYDVNGFDPSVNTDDPAIAGAEVTFTINQKLYYLLGAQRVNPDTSRYRTRQWIYTQTIPSLMPGSCGFTRRPDAQRQDAERADNCPELPEFLDQL